MGLLAAAFAGGRRGLPQAAPGFRRSPRAGEARGRETETDPVPGGSDGQRQARGSGPWGGDQGPGTESHGHGDGEGEVPISSLLSQLASAKASEQRERKGPSCLDT